MKSIIKKLYLGESLSLDDIRKFVGCVVAETSEPAQIGAVLYGLSKADFSVEQIFTLVSEVRKYRVLVDINQDEIVDSCGTGADGAGTINISTLSAIVASASGAKVVKQTNSNITSLCGSSDLIAGLGIRLCKTPLEVEGQYKKFGISFVHSPYFNNFARKINPIRRQVGLRTILNFTGPLINPVLPNRQLVGVSSYGMCEKIVDVLKSLGLKRAFVVCSKEPLIDEFSVCSQTEVFELRGGVISTYTLHPRDLGLPAYSLDELKGLGVEENVRLSVKLLNGELDGAMLDAVCLNASAMLVLSGVADDLNSGVNLAKESVFSYLVKDKLAQLREESSIEAKLFQTV